MRSVIVGAFALLTISASAQIERLLAPVPAKIVERTTAEATTHALGADAFVAEIEKELGARLALHGELKLTLAQPWKPLKLPAADFAVTISETPAGGINGTFLIRVKITSGGETVGEISAQLFGK